MADVTISQLSLIGSANTSTNVPVSDGIATYRATLAQLKTGMAISWNDVANKPTFATVATSGNYNDLSNRPTVPSSSAVAKAYVRFTPSATIDGSYNVSSVAKNGAQDYTVNFTNSLGTASYVTVGTITYSNWSLCGWGVTTVIVQSQTASSVRVYQVRADGACGINNDFSYLNVVCF